MVKLFYLKEKLIMTKKPLRLIALALTAVLAFTACSSGTSSTTTSDSTQSTTTETSGEKVLNYYFSDTPETFNPQTTANNYELLLDMTATLYREIYNTEAKQMQFAPALADGEPVPKDDTNMVWTVKLKEGFTFADGTVIDANVVDYSMKMLNHPKLANRNVNASMLKNGAAYLAGECEWEDVGFKVINDYEIEITFEDFYEPANAYEFKETFSFIGAGVVHPEMFESCLNEDGTETTYGTSLDKFVASGLYKPVELIQGQYLELERRTDTTYLADVYTPDRVTYVAVTDANTAVQLFEQGEIDVVTANQAAYDEYPNAHYQYAADNYGIFINGESPSNDALKDVNMRYALYWGIDREKIVKAVYPTSVASAYQYLHFATMPDPADPNNSVVDYRSTEEAQAIRIDGHEVTQSGYDPDLALEYFEKAYEANGGEKITVTGIYSESGETNKAFAEAIQAEYMNLFGSDKFEIVLQATPSATIYTDISREEMNFDLAFSCGWYNNATAPWNNTNWVYSGPYTYNTQYCYIQSEEARTEWDELHYNCSMYDYKFDAQKKLEACARMEEILLNDCCFVPMYNRGNRYFFSQKLTPVMDQGDVDLGFCLMQSIFN